MNIKTCIGIALALTIGLYCKFQTDEIAARIERDDAEHAQMMMGFTHDLPPLSAIGGGVLSLLSAPPSFFLSAELVQSKSGAGKPVTTKKTQEDRNRTAKSNSGRKVSKSRVPSPVIAKKKGRGYPAKPLSTRGEVWMPATLSTYHVHDNTPRNSRATSLHSRTRDMKDLYSHTELQCAVRFPSRRDLLGKHIWIWYRGKETRVRVVDHYLRRFSPERLDLNEAAAKEITGSSSVLFHGAWFRYDR